MSTSAAMAGVAASQAAIAQAAAHQAKVERCKAEIATFDSKTTTVQQAQSYADCVQTVYPQELSGGGLVAAKIVFVFALLCGIAGAVWEGKRGVYPDAFSVPLFGAMWFICGPLIAGCVIGIFYGIYWVFT